MTNNVMILNDVNIGISKIELDKSDLIVIDKEGKYSFKVCVQYNWQDINSLKAGEGKNIDFNEYILSENNEPAVVWPNKCYVERIDNGCLCFHFKFEDLDSTIHYMNMRNCFDITPKNLEVKVFLNSTDAENGVIIYNF